MASAKRDFLEEPEVFRPADATAPSRALRAMSRRSNPEPLLRMADRAQQWASFVDWSTMRRAQAQLQRSNALVAPDEAEERGLILLDPTLCRHWGGVGYKFEGSGT